MTLTFDLLTLKFGVRVTCDVGYLCANFGLPRPLCSRLRPDVRDRQTDVRQKRRLMPPPIRGGGIIKVHKSEVQKVLKELKIFFVCKLEESYEEISGIVHIHT